MCVLSLHSLAMVGCKITVQIADVGMARLGHELQDILTFFGHPCRVGATRNVGCHQLPKRHRFLNNGSKSLVSPMDYSVEGATDGTAQQMQVLVVMACAHHIGRCVIVVAFQYFVNHIEVDRAFLQIYTGVITRLLLGRFIDEPSEIGGCHSLGIGYSLTIGAAEDEVVADLL